ncbi:MAG: AhpC/TSA family protein [Bacteroidetes bacterium]|nr:AhpC/TSA family protein [Bacteroidota bacterium]
MRQLFLCLMLSAPLGLLAQTGGKFTINGKIKGFILQRVWLIYVKDGKRVTDSVPVKDNSYTLTGTITESTAASVLNTSLSGGHISQSNVAEVYLTPGAFTLTHVDSFSNTLASGSKANEDLIALRKSMLDNNKTFRELSLQYEAAKKEGNTALAEAISKRGDSLYSSMVDNVYGGYIRRDPSAPLALYALERYAGGDMNKPGVNELFEKLPESVKSTKGGKTFRDGLALAASLAVGKTAPDFTQNDTLGNPVRLSSFRGKYVLVDFWASWCMPCRMENPNVVKAYARFHSKGFDIVSVSLDRPGDKDKWIKAIHEDKLEWTHVSDLQFWGNAVAKQYGIQSIPQNYLLDPEGKIAAVNLRGEELEKKLSTLFK